MQPTAQFVQCHHRNNNKSNALCKYFTTARGCRFGIHCRYIHQTVSSVHPTGNTIPCRFYATQQGCKYGDMCRYSHINSNPTPINIIRFDVTKCLKDKDYFHGNYGIPFDDKASFNKKRLFILKHPNEPTPNVTLIDLYDFARYDLNLEKELKDISLNDKYDHIVYVSQIDDKTSIKIITSHSSDYLKDHDVIYPKQNYNGSTVNGHDNTIQIIRTNSNDNYRSNIVNNIETKETYSRRSIAILYIKRPVFTEPVVDDLSLISYEIGEHIDYYDFGWMNAAICEVKDESILIKWNAPSQYIKYSQKWIHILDNNIAPSNTYTLPYTVLPIPPNMPNYYSTTTKNQLICYKHNSCDYILFNVRVFSQDRIYRFCIKTKQWEIFCDCPANTNIKEGFCCFDEKKHDLYILTINKTVYKLNVLTRKWTFKPCIGIKSDLNQSNMSLAFIKPRQQLQFIYTSNRNRWEVKHFSLIEEKDVYQAIENTKDITTNEMTVDEVLWCHLQSVLIGGRWEIKFHQITNKNMFDLNNFKREAMGWYTRWFFGVDQFLFVLDSSNGYTMWCIDKLLGQMFKSRKIIPKCLLSTQFVKTNDGYLHFITKKYYEEASHVRVLLLHLLPKELFILYPLLIFGYIRTRVRLDEHFANWVSKDMVNLIIQYSFKWNNVC